MTTTLPKKSLTMGLIGLVVSLIGSVFMYSIWDDYSSLLGNDIAITLHAIVVGILLAVGFAGSLVLLVGAFIDWLGRHADESLAHAICHDEPELLDHLGIQDPPEEPKQEGTWYCHACKTSDGKHQDWCPVWD